MRPESLTKSTTVLVLGLSGTGIYLPVVGVGYLNVRLLVIEIGGTQKIWTAHAHAPFSPKVLMGFFVRINRGSELRMDPVNAVHWLNVSFAGLPLVDVWTYITPKKSPNTSKIERWT